MKPILEQEWRRTSLGIEVESKDGDAIGTIRVETNAVEDEPALLAFLVAAQDMARALVDVVAVVDGQAHSPLCGAHGLGADKRCHYTCNDINAALKKGGVL